MPRKSTTPRSFAPPSTWEGLKLPLLGHPHARENVAECAIKLHVVTFKSENGETVSVSALRFRALMSRFESAVDRLYQRRNAIRNTQNLPIVVALPCVAPNVAVVDSDHATAAVSV